MKLSEIAKLRMHNQRIIGSKFNKPEEVVSWLGAVQAQDYPAAKWALGLRIKNSTDQMIEEAFNEGRILRTHVMRPTWHFVMPEDIRWMLELTAPRIKTFMGSYNRKLGLDDILFKRTNKLISKTLNKDKQLTRREIKDVLDKAGIHLDGQRLGHVVSWAELDGLICSGPRIGKQFTYALIDDRVGESKKISRDESLAKLALNYFRSHGPAQLKDFSWWSGLTMAEAKRGIETINSKLEKEVLYDKTYWFFPYKKIAEPKEPEAFLLSIYDEYVIAYKDRTAIGDGRYAEKLLSMGNALASVVILNGKIVGTWKRYIKKDVVSIALNLFAKLTPTQNKAIEKASESYRKFLDLEK